MTTYTATYSPDDNKLRLYASSRLAPDVYARVRAAGFIWAPKQELFVAPTWTPAREDLLIELAGEIGDEDTSLTDRAEERAERFDEYSDKRAADAEGARRAVAAIADNIPLGQPILIGHHSERHARKDAERIESGMRRAVKMWETSKYWTERAAGAVAHAKYKERPDVRARRIKGIEADLRKVAKNVARSEFNLRLWSDPLARLKRKDGRPITMREAVIHCANGDGGYFAAEYKRASGYVGPITLWEAAGGNIHDEDPETVAIATPEEICAKAIAHHTEYIEHARRWVAHYENRLAYERAMLGAAGGTVADRVGPEVGGGCRCWASPRGGWSYIKKVNKVSVTVLDNWGNGGRDFIRCIPLDKLAAVMTAAEVQAARDAGRLHEIGAQGFILADVVAPELTPAQVATNYTPEAAAYENATAPDAAAFDAMRETLRAGVRVVSVPQLFPTPRELAERVIELADIAPGHDVLEPSAGTGALLGAMGGRMFAHAPERGTVTAVEINADLARGLLREFPLTNVVRADFLECNGELGTFDRIVMNPPFSNGADIAHIKHALDKLRPGGVLVAICANGPRQQAQLQPLADSWEPLPADTFAGTSVNAALLTITKGA